MGWRTLCKENTDGSAVIAGQSNDGTVSTSMDVWGLRGFYVPESKAFPTVSAGINLSLIHI